MQRSGSLDQNRRDGQTPEIVFKRMGKNAPRNMINAADFMPMPNLRALTALS
jgi:hypothetical protein